MDAGKRVSPTDGLENASGPECRGDHGRRNGRGHGGRPCEESSREHDGGWESGGEENAAGGGRGHGQNRSATKQKEGYEPTVEGVSCIHHWLVCM